MQREYDIGSIFSADVEDVTEAVIVLERNGIHIVDETGSISLTSDILRKINFLLRQSCHMNDGRICVDAINTILKNQNAIIMEGYKANKVLDEFLSTFAINKTRLEVN